MRILVIISSPSEESLSRLAVAAAVGVMRERGAEVTIVDLHETSLPLYSRYSVEHSDAFPAIAGLVAAADAYLLSTPDYHGAMSGALKNFLDYFWKEFAGKTFATVCASHEKGLTATDQIRTVIRQCYGWSLPYGASIAEGDSDGVGIINPAALHKLHILGRDLVVYGAILAGQFRRDVADSDTQTFVAKYRQ